MSHWMTARMLCALLAVGVAIAFSRDVSAAEDDPAGAAAPTTDLDGEPTSDTFFESDAPKATAADLEALSAKVEELAGEEGAAMAGHNAWMLTSSALVLFMTAPGLAMFYGGLVRKKNVLGVIMQCVFLMCLMTVLWALVGYSLSFGGVADPDDPESKVYPHNQWIGSLQFLGMQNVQRHYDADAGEVVTPMEGAVPRLTHMVFQGMFFIITPALICGAFAERMKFCTMVVFLMLWGLLVYCPLCHWVWDGGILAYGPGIAGGALDFAGGAVVHISSGVSALICAYLIGPRIGIGGEDMRPHNMTYTALGAAMLWVGWFGFNSGSAVASDGLAASAFVVTHFAAAAGGLAWASIEWVTRGKASVLGAASGVVAGLVCITPASGFVQPLPAILIGAAAGAACYYAVAKLKAKLGYDDALDAFGVHGVGGTLGAIFTGVFATVEVNNLTEKGDAVGLIDGNAMLMVGQIVAVLATWVYAAVVTLILLKILDATMGLRVAQEEEIQGLDYAEHGEEGYIFA